MPAPAYPVLSGARLFASWRFPLFVARQRQTEHERHAHDFVEIVLVAGGTGVHRRYVAGADGPHEYPIHENDLFVIPPGASHGYGPSDLQIYNLLFEAALVADAFPGAAPGLWDDARGQESTSVLRHKLHLRLADRQTLEGCLRTIARELASRQAGYELLAKAKLMEALVVIDRARAAAGKPASPDPQPGGDDAVADAIAHMEAHLGLPISIESIAESVFLNPTYFCELFKSRTGVSPGKYLARLRVEHAKLLLITTSLPVTAIAQQSGFCDSSHLARVFKAATGSSPRTFREQGRMGEQ